MAKPVHRIFSSIVLLIATISAAGQSQIKELLSYPHPSNLCSDPASGRLAWVFNIEGVRNVYMSADGGKHYEKITDNTEDDGQEISQLQFSPDGKWLVYIRGGEPGGNWSENVPVDPTSSATKTAVELRSIQLPKGKSKVLATGMSLASISISPANQDIAFIKDGAVWTVPADGSREAKQLFFARGNAQSIEWSPDGQRLAFVSQRGDHSFVGIYSPLTPVIKWIDPTFARDVSPKWSPDGRSIVFIRLAASGGSPDSLLVRKPQPWEIRTADLDQSGSHLVWKSPNTIRGSVPTTQGRFNLHWAAGNQIIFMSAMDNWPHLYSVPASGGNPTLLTRGSYMVEYARLSQDKKHLAFSANHGTDSLDIDRRHIGIVPINKPEVRMLTSGAGVEVMPVFLSNEGIACISSTAFRPPLPAVVSAGGTLTTIGDDLLSPVFAQKNLVQPRQVAFRAADGTLVHAQLFIKQNKNAGKIPAVVYIHGGPRRQMLLGWHFSDYYAADYAVNQALAQRGFAVLSVNYRLGIGYGNDFNLPAAGGRNGASEYQDILAAGKWLSRQPEVDPKRIGVYGGSYGGYLTALALGKNSDIFSAGVDIHGVHNLLPKQRFSSAVEAAPDAAKADSVAWWSSPIAYASTWKSPVLFIHADDDRNVSFSETVDLLNRLKAHGVDCETLVIPDDTHHWMLHKNLVTVCERTVEFLVRKLKPGGGADPQ